jgi:hypothetical protein
VKEMLWSVEHHGSYLLRQTNKYYRWIEYIPIVNFFYGNLIWYRKYELIFNNKKIGICDQAYKGISCRFRYVVNGKEYFNGKGYSLSKHSHTKGEWAIESANGEEVAIMKVDHDERVYYVHPLTDELDEGILVLMVMMSDVYYYSTGLPPMWI